jgi:hypothetical protein
MKGKLDLYPLQSYFHSLFCPNVKIWDQKYIANGGHRRVLLVKCIVRSVTAFQRLSTSNLSFIDKHLLATIMVLTKSTELLRFIFWKSMQFFHYFSE